MLSLTLIEDILKSHKLGGPNGPLVDKDLSRNTGGKAKNRFYVDLISVTCRYFMLAQIVRLQR